jgi:hypothetical protein
MERRDDARACAMMTSGLRRGITENLRSDALPGNCRTRAAHVYSTAKAPGNPDATLVRIRVVGNRATATVTAKPTSGRLATVAADARLGRHASAPSGRVPTTATAGGSGRKWRPG